MTTIHVLVGIVSAVAGFYAGHKTQINALVNGALELGPEFVAVLKQIQTQAGSK